MIIESGQDPQCDSVFNESEREPGFVLNECEPETDLVIERKRLSSQLATVSNHQLLSFDGRHVAFRWKDYAHGNKKRKMTLTADEFLSRFLLHVLPPGFVRIRHYGFLANCRRTEAIALCRRLIGEAVPANDRIAGEPAPKSNWFCPQCSAPMMVVERLSACQILRVLTQERSVLDSS